MLKNDVVSAHFDVRVLAAPDVWNLGGVDVIPPLSAVHIELVLVAARREIDRQRPGVTRHVIDHWVTRGVPVVEVAGHRDRSDARVAKSEYDRHSQAAKLPAARR